MSDAIDISGAKESDPEALRDALIDQLAHLIDEVDALRTVVGTLPEAITCGRPAPDALTMKEMYGAIATLDAEVREPRVERVAAEDEPVLSTVEIEEEVRGEGWNERELEAILDRVQEARRELVDRLRDLPLEAWHRSAVLDEKRYSLFELAHRIVQEDLDRLRDLGYRLHGAHLSDRDEPLPT